MKSTGRYREIASVLTHQGFDWLWSKWGIGHVLGHRDLKGSGGNGHQTQAERLRLALEDLGVTFIKVGQVLSTRPDLIPEEYVLELRKLQDQAPLVPYSDIESAIERELGSKPESVYLSFDPVPRAAASIAQVHNAVLQDGTRVVVKVRRPGIENTVEQDLAILGQIARFLVQNTEFGKSFDCEGIVDEFANSIRNELDLTREGQNAERIAANFGDDSTVHIPQIFWQYSSRGVLTMEEVNGIKINDLDALDVAGIDRKKLARNCAHIALEQVLKHGFFHADPHPGNFFIYPNGTIGLIDFGMVGRLDDRLRESLVRIALAVSRKNTDQVIDELLSMGATRQPINRLVLGRDLDHLLSRYDGVPLGDLSASQIFHDITTTAQKHGLTLPSDLVLVVRVIAMDEGLGSSLDPQFNLIEFSKPYFVRFWKESHSAQAVMRRMGEGAFDIADIGLEFPHRLLRFLGMAERGELKVISHVEMPEKLVKDLQQAINRIAISVLTAGLIIGLSVISVIYRPAEPASLVYLVPRGLLALAVGSGVWLLVAFWKSTR
jgi:ubiquinone biosynthesis protein